MAFTKQELEKMIQDLQDQADALVGQGEYKLADQRLKRIKELKEQLKHMKDSMEVLKLSGFTVDAIKYSFDQLVRASWTTWEHIVNNPGKYDPSTVAEAQKLLNTKKRFFNVTGKDVCTNDAEEQWITVNGAHVKIEEGESKESAVKEFIKKKEGNSTSSVGSKSETKSVKTAKKASPLSKEEKAKARWAKKLEEEYELGSPEDIRKNMEEEDEVDEEYLKNYTKQYNIILDHPVGSKVLIGGKEREITDYIPDDDGEDIMAELDGDDWIPVKKLKKSSPKKSPSKDSDPKVAEAEAIINLCGGVR